jgi:hypothetical protein
MFFTDFKLIAGIIHGTCNLVGKDNYIIVYKLN